MGILTESSTFDADITVPVGGEDLNAEVLTAGCLRKLTNRTRYLLNGINGFIVGNGPGADYTPTGDPIQIFGSGFRVIGALFRATGNVEIGNDVGDSFTVTSTSFLNGPVNMTQGLTIGSADDNGPSNNVYGNITFRRTTTFGTAGSPVTVNSYAEWTQTGNFSIAGGSGNTFDCTAVIHSHSDVIFGGSSKTFTCSIPAHFDDNAPTTFDGNVTLGSTSSDAITVKGTTMISAPVSTSGSGRLIYRPLTVLNADYEINASSARIVFFNCGAPHPAATVTVNDTGLVDGDKFRMSMSPLSLPSTTARFVPGLGLPVTIKRNTFASDGLGWAEFVRVDGVWQLSAFGGPVDFT